MWKSNLLQQYEYPFLSVESFYRNSSTWTQGRKVKMEAKLSHGQMRFSLPRRRSWASFTRPRTSAWKASCTWLTIKTAFLAFKLTFKLKCLWNEKLRYWNKGVFERPLKVKENGVFLFVISHIIPEIFTIFVLCKLGTDDVIRCDSMEVKTQSREYLCK